MSYVNYVSYISYVIYIGHVIYMTYVNYELRHELCKLYEYFYDSLKIKSFSSKYIRINLRHQKYKN